LFFSILALLAFFYFVASFFRLKILPSTFSFFIIFSIVRLRPLHLQRIRPLHLHRRCALFIYRDFTLLIYRDFVLIIYRDFVLIFYRED
jgi:hypothetical protein